MFASELVPWIEKRYSTSKNASGRAIIGFSHGGMAALYFALRHPEVFGNCAAYSPALHVGDRVAQYSEQTRLPVKIYLEAGTYEFWLYEPSLQLAQILLSKGYDGHFYSWHEYHTLGSWSAHLDNALTYFWPIE
jgi:enterochelin esterase family protein